MSPDQSLVPDNSAGWKAVKILFAENKPYILGYLFSNAIYQGEAKRRILEIEHAQGKFNIDENGNILVMDEDGTYQTTNLCINQSAFGLTLEKYQDLVLPISAIVRGKVTDQNYSLELHSISAFTLHVNENE